MNEINIKKFVNMASNFSDFEKFHKYVDQYKEVLKLANNLKLYPDELIKQICVIGEIGIKRSGDILLSEIQQNFKNFLENKNVETVVSSIQKVDSFISEIRNAVEKFQTSNEVQK